MTQATAYYAGVYFDGVDLTTLQNIYITDLIGLDTEPEAVFSNDKLSRRDGEVLFDKHYGKRKFQMAGVILANSRASYLQARSTLIQNLQSIEATLRVPFDDDSVDFTATLENVIFDNKGGGFGSFSISFICSDPFGYDAQNRVLLDGASTSSLSNSYSLLETIGGTYATPATFTITFTGLTGSTGKYVDIANEAGDNIRVTRDWSNDDVLVINMKDRTVKVNGALKDYTGNFWNFSVGDTTVTYSTNMTTATAHATCIYKRRRT